MLPQTLQHIVWLPTGAYDNMNDELPKSGGICLTLSSDVGVIVDANGWIGRSSYCELPRQSCCETPFTAMHVYMCTNSACQGQSAVATVPYSTPSRRILPQS